MQHQTKCPGCGQVLDYSHQPPRFCSQCGKPLPELHAGSGGGSAEATVAFEPDPSTRIDTSEPIPAASVPAGPLSVGGYKLLKALGSGGMGTVYEAEQEGTGRRVAVKLIRPEFADSAEAIERFRREGRLASTISHPRCVFVLAAEEEKGRPYIVMELMPGRNLQHLVEQRGPLPVAEAVTLILDIIEGLQEAHRCGLVHRDVKPSNCFLDSDGRVKVGDFGLAKSLLTEQQLTHTGAFLGTLLYAAPEQIRMDPVDHRADIYSVGATLYFLLTGRAPFQTDDAAATLARTMSDPLTPMRKHRGELPATLDEIVLRALQRSPDQRYQSLEELRLALLPFVPGEHTTVGSVSLRVGALLVDFALLWPVLFVLSAVAGKGVMAVLLVQFVGLALGVLYFGLMEAWLGWTLGKLLFRLRVRDVETLDRPRLSQTFLRTLVFYFFKDFGPLLVLTLVVPLKEMLIAGAGSDRMGLLVTTAATVWLLPPLTSLLGLLLAAVSMRRDNGYQGVHELASGTRTIRLPGRRERRQLKVVVYAPRSQDETPLPGKMGAFLVRQALTWQGERGLLLAEDSGLGRQVWIWLHGDVGDAASATRREVGRTTRPRWVASGVQDGRAWDAFVAAPGCPLPAVLRGRMLWADFLPILEQLTDELTAAVADGTLPRTLSLEQVWIEPSGRVQLLDAPLGAVRATDEGTPAERALKLLRAACRLALEGSSNGTGAHLAAPLPGPARHLMDRLFGADGEAYAEPAELCRDLEATKDWVTEVGRPRRGLHLLVQGVMLALGLAFMFLSVPLLVQGQFLPRFLAGAVGEAALSQFRRLPPEKQQELAARAPGRWQVLERQLRPGAAERRLVLASYSDWVRGLVEKLREEFTANLARRVEVVEDGQTHLDLVALEQQMRYASQTLNETDAVMEPPTGFDLLLLLAILGFWPAVWAGWSGLTRGGLSRRLVGIRLVTADGRPAGRLRCLWRCGVVWLPVVLLLAVAAAVDLYRIAAFQGRPDEGVAYAWVAWGSWWLAVLLLPLYAILARHTPARSLLDRLAGTYQVPA